MENKIEILKDNVYLLKKVTQNKFTTIFEWECLATSDKAYKFKDKINDRVFWVDKEEIKNKEFGMDGYFPFECIYDKKKELESTLNFLMKD